ncbi:MAG: hypothetical protein KatS3mg082_2032 [Nitrospiraceae bacterium]|nr:MAG: hypothetical protein KatS3mg082_2032 [Nitrospiraceae bacterium]
MIRRSLFGLMLIAASVASAQDAPDKKADEAKGFDAIVQQMSKESQDLIAKYRAEKNPQEQTKLRLQILGLSQKYATRFMDFARDNPDDPQAAAALARVISSTRGGPLFEQAMKQMIEKHGDAPEMSIVCQALASSADPKAEELLKTISEKSQNRTVQGQALMALATKYSTSAGREGSIEKTRKAMAIYEKVARDFADLDNPRGGKLGDVAKAELENLQKFGIGQIAPEIEAEDIDGVVFKLSDYRGKVVMLDFWGHW